MKTDLAGKVVVVTGASGGIGAAMARRFAAEGARRLVLHYRSNRESVSALQRDVHPVEAIIVRADLSKERDAARLFTQAMERFGRIDTLVANAGSWEERDAPLHQMSLGQWETTFAFVPAGLSCRERRSGSAIRRRSAR